MKFCLLVLSCLTFIPSIALGADLSQNYKIVAELPSDTPPGNIAVSRDGRVFLSVHDFYPSKLRLVELLSDGRTVPYPSEAWANAPVGENKPGLQSVLGLNVDGSGHLWVLDNAGESHPGRLISFNLASNELGRVIYLATPVTRQDSFLNDIAIDTKRNKIYISDTAGKSTSALIVVDLKTGSARRVLEGSKFTVAEDADMRIENKVVTLGGGPARIGVNPITIDNKFDWVYFGPMTGTSLYKVRASALADASLSESDLADKVEWHGDKPISDGITIDSADNVYVTSIGGAAVGVISPAGEYRELFSDKSLMWPDGFATSNDGYIYATINELNRSPVLNGGENDSMGEFKVIRFKPLAQVKPGR